MRWLNVLLAAVAAYSGGGANLVIGDSTPLKWIPATRFEPMGPSSRATQVAISEIQYHPAAREDGLDLAYLEIFNAQPIVQDLGGYRVSGDVEYTFPVDFHLEAYGFVVIAADPAAMEAIYGLASVQGPYTGRLGFDTGVIRLRNRFGAELLRVEYADRDPWPAAADGTGHSLVLARPSYGEGNPAAWERSPRKGGDPGRAHEFTPDPLDAVQINEILAHTEAPARDFIELFNHGAEPVDLSGAFISDRPDENRFCIPAGTVLAGGAVMAFDEEAMGFALDGGGERAFFTNPDNTRTLDAVHFGATAVGVSLGRFPDGDIGLHELADPSPGGSNSPLLIRDIVINEIMFNPLSEAGEDEYVELFNRGEAAVDLSGWRFITGIEMEIPVGTLLAPGGFLVVARDAEHLISRYPGLHSGNTVGNYAGNLANAGERITLARPVPEGEGGNGWISVDSVAYGEGGTWGNWADGDGSSLELIDPRSDNREAYNWTHSDESGKAPWTTIEATGLMEGGMAGFTPNELQIMLLGGGEALLDNVEVIPEGGVNFFPNPTFEEGLDSLLIQGNHVASTWHPEGFESQHSLRIIASGGGDNGANRIEADLNDPLEPNSTVTIRARARWMAGEPHLLLRLQGNWFEVSTKLAVAPYPGTPGAVNSAWQANAGPAISSVEHDPILPQEGDPILVTARIHDVDGVAEARVHVRVESTSTEMDLPMNDAGRDGDAVAGDGRFTAVVPAQTGRLSLAFQIRARDGHWDAKESVFPRDPSIEAMVRTREFEFPGDFAVYRYWMRREDQRAWEVREPLSNQPIPGSFVYNDCRVVHGVGARFRGSPFIRRNYGSPVGILHGNLTAYVLTLPKDERVLGAREFNLDTLEHTPSGSGDRDSTLQREKLSFWIAGQLDIPHSNHRYVIPVINGLRQGKVYADVQQPNGEYFESWFPDDPNGEIFKIDDWFEFSNDVPDSFSNVNARLENYLRSDGSKNQARYRWSWEKKSNGGLNDDYSNLFDLVDAMNTPGFEEYLRAVRYRIDVDEWLKTFAVRHIVADWDGFGYLRGKNQFAYRPENGLWQMVLWDLDFSLGGGSHDTNADMFWVEDPTIGRFYGYPPNLRRYLQTMLEAVEGPLAPTRIEPVMDANFLVFKDNGIDVDSPIAIKSWVRARRNYLTTVLEDFQADFAILTNEGRLLTVDHNDVTLDGTAPLEVNSILVNGKPHPIGWISPTQWRMQFALAPGVNRFTFGARGFDGEMLEGYELNMVVHFSGTADPPAENLVLNEILYHPEPLGVEFVELFNGSSRSAYDLGGYRLNGIGFEFAPGTVLLPGQYLIVVDRLADAAKRYGNVYIAGAYDGALDNGGETLSLIGPGDSLGSGPVIDRVRYDNDPPWPASADGQGASLQLIDPQADNDRMGNWFAVENDGSNASGWTQVAVTGVAADDTLLIHLFPYLDAPAPTDLSGEWEGTIQPPGETVPYGMAFQGSSETGWSVQLVVDGQTVPLDIVEIELPQIMVGLSNPYGPLLWEGEFDGDQQTISGTFSQAINEQGQRVSFPFSMERPASERSVRIDNVWLVAGDTPESGSNLIVDGDFESSLEQAWTVTESHAKSFRSPNDPYSGTYSLQLISVDGGYDQSTAVWQKVPLEIGRIYTLSFWYLPTTNAEEVVVRLADGSLDARAFVHPVTPHTAGMPNQHRDSLPPLPELWINEIQPRNVQTQSDAAGEYDAWIELYNAGPDSLMLEEFRLSTDTANLQQWAFPDGAILRAGAYHLVWLDGDTAQSSAEEWHTPMQLNETDGLVILSQTDTTGLRVVDYRSYAGLGEDYSLGLLPNGNPNEERIFSLPTPGAPNSFPNPTAVVFVNEWMARNNSLLADPSDGRYEDWFELYNASEFTAELEGYGLSDNPGNPTKFVIPPGWSIPPRGYLLIWADGEPEQSVLPDLLHVNFRLDGDGESLVLTNPDRDVLDHVTFGLQAVDRSEGRFPDGDPLPARRFTQATPGASNVQETPLPQIARNSLSLDTSGGLHFSFTSQTGFHYRVWYCSDLADPQWQLLQELAGSGEILNASDPNIETDRHRYYRIEAAPASP